VARDYAAKKRPQRRRRSGNTPKRHAAPSRGTPGWVWMMLGIAIGITVAAAVWVLRPAELERARVVTPGAGALENAPKDKRDDGVKLPPKEESRFSFYDMLPSYEVVIPREEIEGNRDAARKAEPDPREASPKNTPALAEEGDYIIQVGSYRNRDDAESQRAQLALIGLEGRVETVTINDNQTWYRVRVGPIADAPRVHSVMMRMEEHGMGDVMVMRVRN